MEKQRWVLFLHLSILVINLKSCISSSGVNGSFSLNPNDQQKLDRVNQLPGQLFNVDFSHYSGYVTVDENAGRNLFYWFVEAIEDPSSKPLILWMNGGPGCSSVGYGDAMEIGPFRVKEDGKSLYLNSYSWNQKANLLFIDTPVGTGYSYSKDPEDVLKNGDERTANDNLLFLQKWLERFPQYKDTDFYIIGESYADTDSLAPVTSTRFILNALELPTVTPFHAWYDNGQVGGWTQEYKGLTFVSVRGAGHDVPMYKPSLAYPVIKAYLSGSPMPTPSEVEDS